MKRREFLFASTAFGAGVYLMGPRNSIAATYEFPPEAGSMSYELALTPSQWRERLTEFQYKVLREEATERSFTSPLNDEKREGTFHCAGCDLALYSSQAKFDSGTGWPSFYDNIDDAVRTKEDKSWFSTRTEVHCRRCGGHQGHIFKDGPEPTGLRHCINGVAMTFKPADGAATSAS